MTWSVAGPWLIAVACIAIGTACVAILRTRAPGAALQAGDQKNRDDVARARTMEADSRLAGDAAHDLNNLLTAITGNTELLIAGLDPSDASMQYACEIRRAALSAASLTKPLRTLSGGSRSPTDVIDVNAVAARAAEGLRQLLGPNIEVTLALDHSIRPVRIAAYNLEEIVLNIGVHARDAMPHGGRLKVATATHRRDDRNAAGGAPSQYVRLLVSDTGGGMSATAQTRLFEPFFASEGLGGNAVGLAKVDAIVKQAGGRMQVDSTVGVGTTFTIDLPATSEQTAESERAQAAPHLMAQVLVVEDEPGMRELIRVVLVRAGHEVVTVAGPRAALAALNRQPDISLMLVDVVMPEMDGYELVVEARKTAPAVHVVFISAFAPDPARHPSGDGFLAKPFTSESLTGIVQEALSH